ncbi:MAG TPA: hypothetical protein VGK59_01670 [Ohtaekwangia sp.]
MASKPTALFKIEIEEGIVNEYLFYEDGKIEHRYDRSDKVELVDPRELDDPTIQLLLEKCPYEFKGRLKEIINKDPTNAFT